MRFTLTYPLLHHPAPPELFTGAAVAEVARAAEAAGFDALAFTEHPMPSDRWLEAGGHDAVDPFIALTWAAAATEHLRLLTNITVVAYRNPFLLAKTVATLDSLSGGRVILGAGRGLSEVGVPGPGRRLRRAQRALRRGPRGPGPELGR